MPTATKVQQRLVELLADGELHSGSELAEQLGITRSAIWKHIHQLEELGIVLDEASLVELHLGGFQTNPSRIGTSTD